MKAQPKLIVVMGLPATGKTTLSYKLARELDLPLINRDEIKVHILESTGWGDRDWSRKMGKASYDILYYFIERFAVSRTSFVIESDLFAEFATDRLRRLCDAYGYEVIQIIMTADPTVIIDRWIDRARKESTHPSSSEGEQGLHELKQNVAQGNRQPLDVPGHVIEVDTSHLDPAATDESHIDDTIARVRSLLAL